MEPTQEGDYEICFDNSFSHFSEKMVFFEIILEGQGGDVGGDEEWAGLEEPDASLLEYKLEDIRVSSRRARCRASTQVRGVIGSRQAGEVGMLQEKNSSPKPPSSVRCGLSKGRTILATKSVHLLGVRLLHTTAACGKEQLPNFPKRVKGHV